ncbi:MAG: hypothetical protein WAJ85_15455 [Candidatus Baltobacteraceae bacterium]|jgi:hypothetical protein
MIDPIHRSLKGIAVGIALVAGLTATVPQPARADTTSTVLIAAGAAAIVGALLIDANNRPYYVNDNRRYYVTQSEATYYRSHRGAVRRQAWVPENQFPVERNAGYNIPQQRGGHGGHGGQGNHR